MAYTILDFAEDILAKVEKPLTYQEIWAFGIENNLTNKLALTGKTPWQTLGARLYVDTKENPSTKFIKVGKNPVRFFLASRKSEVSLELIEKINLEQRKEKSESDHYEERDLHPLLTYFAYSNPSFNRGRNIFTKTIFHEKSKKSGYSEWLHPDLVGFYLPIEEWSENLIEFNRISDNNALKLFSFEMKKSINKGNYRENYFQAVSNSSWAHEGYLVSAQIVQDDDLLAELERLTMSFGIGIIQLELKDIDSSKVLFPAKQRPSLDWETMNKLTEQNKDFNKFIKDVKIDFNSKVIHKSEYDAIISNPEDYIKKNILKHKK